MSLPEGVLNSVKNYLDITWSDTDVDGKVSGLIKRGIRYLDTFVGSALDYTVEEQPLELLLEYCYYAYNSILSDFIVKYTPQLINLKINYGGDN